MRRVSILAGSLFTIVTSLTGCTSNKTLTSHPLSAKSTDVQHAKKTTDENPDPIRRYLVWDAPTMQNHLFDGDDSVWMDGDWHYKDTLGTRYVSTATKNGSKKPVISVLNLNMPSSSNWLIEPMFACPRDIGHIAISSIAQSGRKKWMLLYFVSTPGTTGTFNLQTYQWSFSSTKGTSTFVKIDPIQPLSVQNQPDFSGATSAWIDGDWHANNGGFGARYVATYMDSKSNPKTPYIRVVYMNRGKRNGYFYNLEPLVKMFPCPRQIGRITISHITDNWNVVDFTSATGVRGTWNVESHEWSFD